MADSSLTSSLNTAPVRSSMHHRLARVARISRHCVAKLEGSQRLTGGGSQQAGAMKDQGQLACQIVQRIRVPGRHPDQDGPSHEMENGLRRDVTARLLAGCRV